MTAAGDLIAQERDPRMSSVGASPPSLKAARRTGFQHVRWNKELVVARQPLAVVQSTASSVRRRRDVQERRRGYRFCSVRRYVAGGQR